MSRNVKLSGVTPVSISYEGGKADFFNPVRTSSCEVNIVDKKILNNLYSAKKNDVTIKVKDKDDSSIVWQGYVTPNIYSQSVSQAYDTINVTCIDPLGMLKYYKISDIYKHNGVVNMKDFLGKVLVIIDIYKTGTLYVENNVVYNSAEGPDDYDITVFDLQLSNFYDELDDDTDLNTALGEVLRLFSKYIIYDGNDYYIKDCTNIATSKTYDKYSFSSAGLTHITTVTKTNSVKNIDDDYKPNNTSSTDISIDATYSRFDVVASTIEQELSNNIGDDITEEDKEGYTIYAGNVNVSKITGGWPIEDVEDTGTYKIYRNRYKYLFNGLYVDSEYGLYTDETLDGYNNIWQFKNMGNAVSYSNETGSVLNYYGSADNLKAPHDSTSEKSVNINKCITIFAKDNGIAPEFMDEDYFYWSASRIGVTQRYRLEKIAHNNKGAGTSNVWGSTIRSSSEKLAYKTRIDNIILDEDNIMTLDLDISQKYSRTGTKADVCLVPTSNAEHSSSYSNITSFGYVPCKWKQSEVKYTNEYYYNIYNNSGIANFYDKHKVVIKAIFNEGKANEYTRYFSGMNWVDGYSYIHLGNLKNGKEIFNEYKPDLIFVDAAYSGYAGRYAFTLGESKTIYFDRNGNYSDSEKTGGSKDTIPSYKWVTKYLNDCSEGELSIVLPYSNDVTSCSVEVEIYTGQLFGTAGSHNVNTDVEDAFLLGDKINIDKKDTRHKFIPPCVSYCKAEHFDITACVSSQDSNRGKMYDESDIKYSYEGKNGYFEKMEIDDLRVNTYNDIVPSSASYLIYYNGYAKPDNFVINGINCRPENYLLNGYINLYGTVRKEYQKTIKLLDGSDRINLYDRIYAPEVSENSLTIVGYSYDLKSHRYTITAVEDHDLKVVEDKTIKKKEVPHIARNYRVRLKEQA